MDKKRESYILKTSGEPASIRIMADRIDIRASKSDLSYVKIEILDKEGNIVPDAEIPIKISCSGNGNVIASGNGAYADMHSFRSMNPKAFRGNAIAIVQPNGEKGEILLKVSAEGFEEATTVIKTN